ncbi:5699_t:CDS:2 [Dentiscutata heterogama]|uniref:5699_t:CDS:1 n=1 Tax=Dentiscutata heterogama TaxID=1316150 RepID=A0ACA9KFP5_9GLOM|nr:5699_t:CDS:2 [Dentiscutata heterogama]
MHPLVPVSSHISHLSSRDNAGAGDQGKGTPKPSLFSHNWGKLYSVQQYAPRTEGCGGVTEAERHNDELGGEPGGMPEHFEKVIYPRKGESILHGYCIQLPIVDTHS